MRPAFLTAEWRKLIMVNYAVEPSVLVPFLPAKTELDLYGNRTFISLVGFMFKDVRVKGFKIPFHVNFPEVNLRMYVRYKENDTWKRGVVFIKEIVPKHAITYIANNLYGEHYSTKPMTHFITQSDTGLYVGYHWKNKRKWNKIEVTAESEPGPLAIDSEEEFITEHFWGYSSINHTTTAEYQVVHPRWQIYRVTNYKIECDFEQEYGSVFSFLTGESPVSVFLAEGSAISVHRKRTI